MKFNSHSINKINQLGAFLTAIGAAVLLSCPMVASATITPTGPFTGNYSETFESFPDYIQGPTYQPEPVSIMGGFATLSSANHDMNVYNPSAGATWGLGGSFASISDGNQGLGLNSSNDTAIINFSGPVTGFGGYFGAGYGVAGYNGLVTFNFSDGSSASFTYSDPGNLNPSPLVWDGWNSSVAITSVSITGNYLAMDGLQAMVTPTPEPTTLALAGLGGLALLLARRRAA